MKEESMDPGSNVLFLSLRPEFAGLLLDGQKTVELRRIRPRAPVGTLVFVYASSPQCELLGVCRVAAIGEASPSTIWNLHGTKTGIRRSDFRTYFQGTTKAVAITVTDPLRLECAISLVQLRAAWANFQPPQSFRYLSHIGALRLLNVETYSQTNFCSPAPLLTPAL
jgi:predicted transcriptional regulator